MNPPTPIVQIIEVFGPAAQGKSMPLLCGLTGTAITSRVSRPTAPAYGENGFVGTWHRLWVCLYRPSRWFNWIRHS